MTTSPMEIRFTNRRLQKWNSNQMYYKKITTDTKRINDKRKNTWSETAKTQILAPKQNRCSFSE